MTPQLSAAIQEFALRPTVQHWSSPVGARDDCGRAAEAFHSFLTKRDIPSEKYEIIGRPAFVVAARATFLPLPDDDLEFHTVVKAEGILIDWTRRQYDPMAASPHLATKQELIAEGWSLVLPSDRLRRAEHRSRDYKTLVSRLLGKGTPADMQARRAPWPPRRKVANWRIK